MIDPLENPYTIAHTTKPGTLVAFVQQKAIIPAEKHDITRRLNLPKRSA
jgi:hypothetical protein